MTDENKTADTILGKPKKVRIGRKYIWVKPLTFATLIEASSVLSSIPNYSGGLDRVTAKEILAEVLTDAKNYKDVGLFIATLALGCPHPLKDSWWKRRKRKRLAAYILGCVPTYEYTTITTALLEPKAIQHFFQYTASLSELSILRPKRKSTPQSGE